MFIINDIHVIFDWNKSLTKKMFFFFIKKRSFTLYKIDCVENFE